MLSETGLPASDAPYYQRCLMRAPWLADYAFVIRGIDDIEALLDADFESGRSGVDMLSALFVADRISPERYTQDLAAALGVPSATYDVAFDAEVARNTLSNLAVFNRPVSGYWRGLSAGIVCATEMHPRRVEQILREAAAAGTPLVLIAGRPLLAAIERASADFHLRSATSELRRRLPLFSAARRGPAWQSVSVVALLGLIGGAAIASPSETIAIVIVLLTVPFSGVVLVRLIALGALFRPAAARTTIWPATDRDLPIYSVMVALYDEAQVLSSLVAALSRLDYPAAKLDCMLVIEDVDNVTKAALLTMALPAFVRVIIVPDGRPRTKPRALNYALKLARGDFVVIYDAEDRPEPDQLRRALAAFQAASLAKPGTPPLACVQACLNIFNSRQSWLTRGIMAQTPQAI